MFPPRQSTKLLQPSHAIFAAPVMSSSSAPPDQISLASQSSIAPKPNLLNLPLNLKYRIFEFLLRNPILGHIESISVGTLYGATLEYGLSPAILRVCRQLYNDGSSFLYGQNTFIIECVNDAEGDRSKYDTPAEAAAKGHIIFNSSPLTRHWNWIPGEGTRWPRIPSIQNLSAVRKVRHWKLIISSTVPLNRNGRGSPPAEITNFCRAICLSAPQSLQVLIVPSGEFFVDGKTMYKPISLVLKPLQILRRWGKLEIAEATSNELYSYLLRYGIHQIPKAPPLDKSLVPLLRALAAGTGPVEFPSLMYKALLLYATAFERYAYFKYDMDIRYYKSKHNTPFFSQFSAIIILFSLSRHSGTFGKEIYCRKLDGQLYIHFDGADSKADQISRTP